MCAVAQPPRVCESVEVAGECALAEQISGFGSETVLRNLMKVGFFHRATTASNTGKTASSGVALIAVDAATGLITKKIKTDFQIA